MLQIFTAVFLLLPMVAVSGSNITVNHNIEEEKFGLIRNIIEFNGNRKGWTNLLTVGNWTDSFYTKVQGLVLTSVVANEDCKGYTFEGNLRYPAHTLLLECKNFEDFERKFKMVISRIPYWHPHSNTIVYLHNVTESNEIKARIFFSLWYYRSSNAIIVQYQDSSETMIITHFNQYVNEKYTLEHSYGCWTKNKITLPVRNLKTGIVCTKGCHNVTLHSKLRAQYLGTCVGFESVIVPYNDNAKLKKTKLFEDKAKNLHGYTLRAHAPEVIPFLVVDENNGSFTVRERDGFIWNAMAEVMNFTFDVLVSAKKKKEYFDFEVTIQQIYNIPRRTADLLLVPVYQFDLIILDVDQTFPIKGSGLCFLSQRADFETNLFDMKLLQSNYTLLIKSVFCFFGTWLVFFVFNIVEKGVISYDQAGKDLVNAIRNILSISLHRPPKRESFKIFLLVSIWSFFIMNFATQAAIISFFSAFKRGKEIDTFDDIIETGYHIEGLSSPDVMLPQTEEKYQKINSKIVPIRNFFACVRDLMNDSHKFCLIDCSIARYLERNHLDDQGEQYLHVAKDQIHSYYLNMIFSKNSALTDEYNRNMLKFLQGGFINKWEQYRYADMKYEAPVKSLDMKDVLGIFKCYLLLVGFSVVIFAIEVCVGAREDIR